MSEDYIAQLAKSHERLRTMKLERKDKNAELKEECDRDPSFAGFMADKAQAQENIKRIKDETAARTGLKADLDELKDNIALEKEVIAGCVEHLIAEGKLRAGETLDVGDYTITPSISVNLHAQMKLL